MRLIEKFSESIKVLNDYRNLYHAESSSTEQYKVANAINDILPEFCRLIESDAEPVKYQPMSKDFARMITKGIASLLSELQLDLPSIIYEDIESNLLKGKFADVECFIKNYVENNGAKMDEKQG